MTYGVVEWVWSWNILEWNSYSKWLQITSNLNCNNSQTNYLYMELFHVDDSNEVFSGFRIVRFWKVMMIITNEGPDADLLRSGPHTTMLILWILPDIQTK